MANWVVNNVATGKQLTISEMKEKTGGGGDNKCPTDGVNLVGVGSDLVPEDISIKKCNQCGWWWFPESEVFKFVKAMNARREYVKLWNKSDWLNYAWPALALVVLMSGLVGAVAVVREQQRGVTQATERIKELSVVQVSSGTIEVRFKADVAVEKVEYKMTNELRFRSVNVNLEGEYMVAKISGLRKGLYVVRVMERESRLEVKY